MNRNCYAGSSAAVLSGSSNSCRPQQYPFPSPVVAARLVGMAFIMIVEDNADACEPLAKYLEKAGHEVKCAPNGREALAQVLAKPPDVVLLDLLMPEMDGRRFSK